MLKLFRLVFAIIKCLAEFQDFKNEQILILKSVSLKKKVEDLQIFNEMSES